MLECKVLIVDADCTRLQFLAGALECNLRNRKRAGGSRKVRFTEGWVEFPGGDLVTALKYPHASTFSCVYDVISGLKTGKSPAA